jgi:hypothetical protein
MGNLNEILEDNHFYDFEIITPDHESNLPSAWQAVIFATGVEEKREILNKLWQPFAGELRLTIALFSKLDDAVVIKQGGEFKLVYIFNIADTLSAHVGHLPVQDGPFMNYLPADVAAFYKTVHNGWFENTSGGMGFLSLQDIEWLSQYEWEILENIPPLDFDISATFKVFHNAGGGYLCFNVTNKNAPECLIFWTTKEPKRNLSFWPLMDSWIEIGLTN